MPRAFSSTMAALTLIGALAVLPRPGAAQTQQPEPKAKEPASRAEAKAAEPRERLLQPDTDLIDSPTASVLDYGSYATRTRFFSGGGFLELLSFGVFHRLNIGASLNVDRLVGSLSDVRITRPDLQVKYRFFDGDRIIPAFAVGFEGQGFLYNRAIQRYNQRQRGLYVVGSQEIGLPGLEAHAGANISDFNSNGIFGSIAMNYNVRDKVLLMSEWDNINDFRDSRVNLGLRAFVTTAFHVDFAVRGVGQGGDYSDGVSRGPERVVMLKYTGSF